MNPSYDNSFGSFGSNGPNFGMSAPIVSGNNEMELPNSSESKIKKWPLVLLAFLFVVALVAGLVSMVGQDGGQGNGGLDTVAKSDGEAFNIYANYYLYGEAKTDEITAEYNETKESYLNNLIDEDNVPSEYLDNLVNYYAEFLSLYEGSSQDNEETMTLLNGYKAQLDLVTTYLREPFLTRSDILDAYLLSGEVAAESLIKTKLQSYKDLENINDMSFYSYALNWAERIVELGELYKNLGCINENEEDLDYNCIYEKGGEEIEKISDEAAEDYYYVLELLNNSRDNLYGQLFVINKAINVEQEDE